MWRYFRRWLGVLIVQGFLCLPAQAQDEAVPKGGIDPPVKEYAIAALSVMLVMVVVCKPSRNRN